MAGAGPGIPKQFHGDYVVQNRAAGRLYSLKLSELVAALPAGTRIIGDLTREISGLADHSGSVQPGFLFVSVPGTFKDGHEYIPEAIRNGAVAVVAQRDFPAPPSLARVLVADSYIALSALADRFHGSPSQRIRHIAGVTGTNGKTTAAFLLKQLAQAQGLKPGVIGTAGVLVGDAEFGKGGLTTPGAIELHDLLQKMAAAGVDLVSMEVSSHALQQHRTDHLRFDAAAFTNLTHEHLDYHGDMEHYYQAKARLFRQLQAGAVGITNLDDEYGARLVGEVAPGVRLLTYSLERPAHLQAEGVSLDARGSARFRLVTPFGSADLYTPGLFGRYNVSNALAAAGMALGLGMPFDQLCATLEKAQGAPGRFEPVDLGQDFLVVVDYAHTPDGFTRLFESVQHVKGNGRVLLVFGSAGGGRDKTKRPIMGRIAARHADIIILTEEDTRWEDTHEIMGMIYEGTKGEDCQVEMVEDRLQAIDRAIALARPSDLVLILGKGNETFLAVNHPTTYRGDVPAARESLARRLQG